MAVAYAHPCCQRRKAVPLLHLTGRYPAGKAPAPRSHGFPAQELETFVLGQVHLLLQTPDKCTAGSKTAPPKKRPQNESTELAKKMAGEKSRSSMTLAKNIIKACGGGPRLAGVD